MALAVPIPNDRKRVKVYELRDNDWFDRGTGFCTGQILNVWAFLFFFFGFWFLFLFFSPRSVSLDARAPCGRKYSSSRLTCLIPFLSSLIPANSFVVSAL